MTGRRRSGSGAAGAAARSPTRRCWAPSWRLRSSRRRSASPAATIRSRDACSSASRACALGLQVLVLERDRGRRGHRLDAAPGRRRATRRRRARRRGRPSRSTGATARSPPGRGQLDPLAGGVGVGLVLGQPVRDHEAGVAERARERRLEVAAAHRPEPEEQLRQPAAREPRAQQPGEERERHGDERAGRQPQQRLRAGAGDEVVHEQRGEQQQGERAGEARQQRPAPRPVGMPPARADHGDRDDARRTRAGRAGPGRSRARRPRRRRRRSR